MPFDGNLAETAAARRAQLITALRREMPPMYLWDFGMTKETTDCGTRGCAVGLATILWPSVPADISSVSQHIGITAKQGWRIFGHVPSSRWPAARGDDVTPQMVADALEKCR
jgi:hypothetical protein